MTLTNLSHLQSTPPILSETWDGYRSIIETAIAASPRTLQTRIGPSEIGNTCDACLVSKLAGIPETRDVAWRPFVGTAVHSELQTIFALVNAELVHARYLVEATVSVGEIGGVDITGHADLFDVGTGTVTDWKVIGATTLRKVKPCIRKPEMFGERFPTYHIQSHLYGYGFTRRGLTVNTVQVAFLPRNEATLTGAVIIRQPYDEQVALTALARADQFARFIAALGVEAVLTATGGHTGDEYSCARYGYQAPTATPQEQDAATADQLDGLLPTQTPDAATARATTAA